MDKHNNIVFFDGICNLCNASIDFIVRHEKGNQLKFASLQSEIANQYLTPENREQLQTIQFFHQNKTYTKSTAVLKISKHLKFPWNLGIIFLIIPKFIRDFVYDLVATNRYKWFGQKNTCRIPTEEERGKFLG